MSNEVVKTKEELTSKAVEANEEILNSAVDKLMSDKENFKKIFTAANPEEVKQVFRTVGLEVTDEQLEIFKKTFADSMSAEINNLPVEEREKLIEKASEAELEKTSGGRDWTNTKQGLGIGLDLGVGFGASVGGLVAVSDFVLSLVDGSFDDEPDERNTVWLSLKRSFKRGIGTMAAVGA
ncbi:MAG: hypothetical protein ACI4PJ_02655, partial [Acutalibacteraceae bacterium]